MAQEKVLAIPLKFWNTAIADVNKEPILILTLSNDAKIAVMMPSETASAMGKALQTLGKSTAPPPVTQRN